MKKTINEKGITLIALVVTIIILLILAGVTLSMTLSQNGLFNRAQNAADKYKKAQKAEEDLISEIGKEMYKEYIGAYVDGYTPDVKTEDNPCKIGIDTSGYTEEQTFTTDDMKWRIWDFDGTILRLISEKPTNAKLALKGAVGYNNGVYAINEVCRECYGKNESGITVSNIKRSDVERVTKYDYTKYSRDNENSEDKGENGKYKYGSVKIINESIKYPKMWNVYDSQWTYRNEKGNITGNDKECLLFEQENGYKTEQGKYEQICNLEFKQSYWLHDFGTEVKEDNMWIDDKYYDLIFKDGETGKLFNKSYLLACRYTSLYDDRVTFGLTEIYEHDKGFGVGGDSLFKSDRE